MAVDHKVLPIGLQHGGGAHRRQIGTGPRLGEALRPPGVATQDVGQVLLLLRLGAKGQQDRGQHLDAAGDDARCATQQGFLVKDVALHMVPARAAMRHGPAGGEPATRLQNAKPGHVIGVFKAQAQRHLAVDVGG